MIAIPHQDRRRNNHIIFEDLLPAIRQHAQVAFRFNPREERESMRLLFSSRNKLARSR